MSALTVTLGADITALKRAMAGATELVSASAKRMGKITGAGLAELGKGGAVALQQRFSLAGTAFKASIGAAMAGGAAAVGGVTSKCWHPWVLKGGRHGIEILTPVVQPCFVRCGGVLPAAKQ